MRAQYRCAALIEDLMDGWQAGIDTVRISDPILFSGGTLKSHRTSALLSMKLIDERLAIDIAAAPLITTFTAGP
jgi:hypothetical protein